MKAFKKILFLVLTLCISYFLLSCQDDTDDEQNPSENSSEACEEATCLEVKSVEFSATGEELSTSLSEYITINGKKIISKTTNFKPSSTQPYFTVEYKYNSDGNIIEYASKDHLHNESLNIIYTYEGKKLIRTDRSSEVIDSYIIYEYTEGIDKYTKSSLYFIYNTGERMSSYTIHEYDTENRLIKESHYDVDGSITGYNIYNYNKKGQYIGGQYIDETDEVVIDRILTYQDCLLLKDEQTLRGRSKIIKTNTIRDGKIVSQELTNELGEVSGRYIYENECE